MYVNDYKKCKSCGTLSKILDEGETCLDKEQCKKQQAREKALELYRKRKKR